MARTTSILQQRPEPSKTARNCYPRFGPVTFCIMAWPRRVLRTILDFWVFRIIRKAIQIGKGMHPGAWTPRTPRTGARPTSPHMEICVGIMHSMENSFRTGNSTSDSDWACRSAFFGILQTWNLKNLRKSFVFTGFAKSENFAKIRNSHSKTFLIFEERKFLSSNTLNTNLTSE